MNQEIQNFKNKLKIFNYIYTIFFSLINIGASLQKSIYEKMQPQQKQASFVFFWGKFKDEQQPVPKQVTQLSKSNITKVKSGGFFYLAANNEGELWGWGTTKNNRFGLGGPQVIPIPKKIPLKIKVNLIAAGNWHSIITDLQGIVYGVGHNKYGSLGIGNFENANDFIKAQIDFSVSDITAGDGFSILISTKGQMYGAGHNSFHGHKSKDNLNIFKRICEQQLFSKVSAGFTHSLAISQKGQVYSWGEGGFYQLGHGNKNDIKTPKKIQGLADQKIVSVSCTRGQKNAHSMVASIDGAVYTWGAGYKGKLGHFSEWSHADPADQPLPRLMKDIEIPVTKVFGGGIHSGVLNKNGQLLTFGCGSDGRLGHIESTDFRYLYREGLPRKIQTLKNYITLDASFSYYHNICVAKKCSNP